MSRRLYVLIDTWWNVNITFKAKYIANTSFNRYMVECEFRCVDYRIRSHRSFNRYMVECEYIERLISEVETDGF